MNFDETGYKIECVGKKNIEKMYELLIEHGNWKSINNHEIQETHNSRGYEFRNIAKNCCRQ
jgi:hypothetical protein